MKSTGKEIWLMRGKPGASYFRMLSLPYADGGDSKALDKIAITGSHARPEAKIPIVGTVEVWEDKCGVSLSNERVRRNGASREVVSEFHAVAGRLTSNQSCNHRE